MKRTQKVNEQLVVDNLMEAINPMVHDFVNSKGFFLPWTHIVSQGDEPVGLAQIQGEALMVVIPKRLGKSRKGLSFTPTGWAKVFMGSKD